MKRPTPSMAVALTALVFSATGTGIAASKYVITSTSQIKPNVLRSLKAQHGPNGYKGDTGQRGLMGLAGPEVHGPEGPKGPTGPEGQKGTGGVTGPTGIALSTLGAVHATNKIAAKTQGAVAAFCPEGSRLVAGGGNGAGQPIVVSQPANEKEKAWLIEVQNTTAAAILIEVTAICAKP